VNASLYSVGSGEKLFVHDFLQCWLVALDSFTNGTYFRKKKKSLPMVGCDFYRWRLSETKIFHSSNPLISFVLPSLSIFRASVFIHRLTLVSNIVWFQRVYFEAATQSSVAVSFQFEFEWSFNNCQSDRVCLEGWPGLRVIAPYSLTFLWWIYLLCVFLMIPFEN